MRRVANGWWVKSRIESRDILVGIEIYYRQMQTVHGAVYSKQSWEKSNDSVRSKSRSSVSLDLKNSIYGENVPSKFGEDDDGKSFTYFIIVSKTSMLFWSEIFIA